MTEWPILTITSWKLFGETVESLDIGGPSNIAYTFRGQADKGWPLEHSLARKLPDNISENDAIDVEKFLMSKFQEQAHFFADVVKLDDTDLPSYWMLMQNHGAPTRVLDWTASPFVALYFAVNQKPNQDGAVYIINQGRVILESQKRFGADYDIASGPQKTYDKLFRASEKEMLFPVQLIRSIQRVAVQQGRGTICTNILAKHSDVLLDVLGDVDPSVTKYHKLVIPAQLKMQFLQRLRQMNITPNSLFPGIDGLGMDISDLAYIESRSKVATE